MAADFLLVAHVGWILWVIFGALWTRNRPVLAAFHVAALVWGIIVELGPWECPLTLVEQHFQTDAGVNPYQGGFILRWLDEVVYPDLPRVLVAWVGAGICFVNLAIYVWRYWRYRHPDLQQ